jgi:hypothetical protein
MGFPSPIDAANAFNKGNHTALCSGRYAMSGHPVPRSYLIATISTRPSLWFVEKMYAPFIHSKVGMRQEDPLAMAVYGL